MVDVVALGAIVESEDLTAPPRQPTLDEGGYVRPWTPEELDAYLRARDRVFAEDYVYPPDRRTGIIKFGSVRKLAKLGFKSGFCVGPPETMMAGRRKTLESGSLSLYAEEFADLSDGQRVILKDDRGWSDRSDRLAIGCDLTLQAIRILDPDGKEFWMKWVVERLRFLGIDVDPVSVQAAPFKVEFGPRIQRELWQRESGGWTSVLDIIALGAIVETEDLTAPPRYPKFTNLGYTHPPTPEDLEAAIPESRRRMLKSGALSFYAEEFADLNDGRRVILKDNRSWYLDSSWKSAIGRDLTERAIWILKPNDPNDKGSWVEWIVRRLRSLGIDVDPVSVRAAPLNVEFGPRVRRELRQRKPGG